MQKHYIYILALFLFPLFTGCVTTKQPSSPNLPPRFDLPTVAEPKVEPSKGAIFNGNNTLNLYRDNRARNIGDIILVKIVETSSGATKAMTKTERESGLSGGISSFFGFEKWLSAKNPRFIPSPTSIQSTFSSEFDGTGETRRNNKVTGTISAQVVNTTMNGNLIIRGYQEVRVNNEVQSIIISGIVRPEDISPNNSILSSHIANGRIEYAGQGVIAEKQHPGWLAQGLNVLWPF